MQHLLQALSEMAHTDDSLAHSLWVLLLPIIWATLGEKKDQQVLTSASCTTCNSARHSRVQEKGSTPSRLLKAAAA